MLLNELKEKISTGARHWQQIKTDLAINPEAAAFLNKSRIVVANSREQADIGKFDDTLMDIALDHPGIFKNTRQNNKFIAVCKQVKTNDEKLKKLKVGNTQEDLTTQIEEAQKALRGFDMASLDFVDDLNVEVRLCSLNMELIQMIKQHPSVNTHETCQCRACIRVVLK
jgi:hypothetical protein